MNTAYPLGSHGARPGARRVVFALIVAWLCAGCGDLGPGWARSVALVRQERAEVPTVILSEAVTGQQFVAPRDGLSSIEVLLVVPQDAPTLPSRPVRWALSDELGQAVAQGTLETATLTHNTPLRFDFPPLAGGSGQSFRLTVNASPEARISLWASQGDTLAEGWLFQNDQPTSQDLWIRASITQTPQSVVREARGLVQPWQASATWLLPLLFGPGALLWRLLRQPHPAGQSDAYTPPIMAMGLSLAFPPLLLLWAQLVGLRLTNDLIRNLLLASLLTTCFMGLRDWPRTAAWLRATVRSFPGVVLFLLLIVAAIIGRLLTISDLAVPPWVDGVHHTMIVSLFQRQGGLPTTYRPFLDLDLFTYHFGFHALAALLAEASHQAAPKTTLLWGQVINVAALPALFLLARRMGRSTWAGFWGMTIPLLALMPAYFTTWGRYTQLLGLVLLPLALVAALDWLEMHGPTWSQDGVGRLIVAALLGGGLLLSHYRILIYYALFLALAVGLVRWRRQGIALPSIGTQGGRLVVLALAVLALTGPWLWRLWFDTVRGFAESGALQAASNDVPQRFLEIDITPILLVGAIVAVAIGIAARNREVLLLPLWVGLLALCSNPNWLGLRPLWLLNNEALVISYWLPVGLALGVGVGVLGRLLEWRTSPRVATVGLSLLTLPVVIAGLYGAWWRTDIINPVTIIATAEDVEAAIWIDNTLPREAKFLINSRFWQGSLYVGSDGGYWLPILANRQTTLPPVHYAYGDPATQVQINALAAEISQTDNLDDAGLRARLRAMGVTHIYVGAQGGSLNPAKLRTNPALAEIRAQGRVSIFELRPE